MSRRLRHAPALTLAALLAAGPRPAGADQAAFPCVPGQPSATRLHVIAIGAHSSRGSIAFTLYGSDPAKFLVHHGALALTRAPLAGAQAETCFALSEPGAYAVAIYHDENDNRRFDRTLIGLPAEGYGFSNDAPTPFGLPSFRAVKITIDPGETRITVRLRY